MDKKELRECLTLMNHMREERLCAAELIRNDPSSIPLLLEFIFDEEEKYGFKGGWALDLALQEELDLILPYLDIFIAGLSGLTNESAIRPMAKICEALCFKYYKSRDPEFRLNLKLEYRKEIAEVCFDWLIGEHKVAPKAYAMTALGELGKEFEWIHPELELVLRRNYEAGSAGYKARARKVLHAIDTGR